MLAALRVGAEAQAEMLTDADLVAIGMTETTTAEVVAHALALGPQMADTTDHMVAMMDIAEDAATTAVEEAEAAARGEARIAEMAHHH